MVDSQSLAWAQARNSSQNFSQPESFPFHLAGSETGDFPVAALRESVIALAMSVAGDCDDAVAANFLASSAWKGFSFSPQCSKNVSTFIADL